MSSRTRAPGAGTRPVRHDGGRHRQPRTAAKGGATTAKAGRKAAAAGLLRPAALTVPAAGLWASPSSVTLTHLNPRAFSVQALTGQETRVRIYKYGKPVQRSAPRGQSRRPAAPKRAVSPQGSPAGGVADPTASMTASQPADPAAVVLRPDGTPETAGGAGVTPGAGGTATAMAARQSSEVFDVNGNLAGFTVGNQATGTVQLVGRTGSVLGTVQAGQAPGSLFVVGPAGTVHGQLGINPATGAVTLVAATSSAAPASPSPATGTATDAGMPEPSTATTPPSGPPTERVVGDPSDPLA